MVKRRHRDIEQMVQDSVFHPSPCRRLRERVLRDAARAQRHQAIGRRALAGIAALSGAIIAVMVLFWFLAGSKDAAQSTPENGSQRQAPTEPGGSPGTQWKSTSTRRSLGEALLQTAAMKDQS